MSHEKSTQNTCTATFETFPQLEQHMKQGVHEIPKATSSLDCVKKSFANRLLMAASSHSHITSSPIASTSSESASPKVMVSGWALPIRPTFRFNPKQKAFLFKAFENGEKTGKKESPEDVHLSMRKSFPTNEYCTVKQIRSLFSRWSRQLRTTSLDDLQEKVTGKLTDEILRRSMQR